MTHLERLAEEFVSVCHPMVLNEPMGEIARAGFIAGAKKMQEFCVEIAEQLYETGNLSVYSYQKIKSLTEERET